MSIWIILITAMGLSMDALAVALASGKSVSNRMQHALRLGLAFGTAQMIMPIIGWLLGHRVKDSISAFDHWLAFFLLAVIGFKMIRESFEGEDCVKEAGTISNKRLLGLAVATSIDALVVGVTFAFLDCPLLLSALVIGVVTFVISTFGAYVGCFCCCIWGRRAERFGGVVLILIGAKILLEHIL